MISILKIALDFSRRMNLVREYNSLSKKMEHLEWRFNIDKVSDPQEANEVKAELTQVQDQLKKILKELSF